MDYEERLRNEFKSLDDARKADFEKLRSVFEDYFETLHRGLDRLDRTIASGCADIHRALPVLERQRSEAERERRR